MRAAMMACRMAGRLGWGGGKEPLFFPLRLFQAPVLEEGKGDHDQERVPMEPPPGAAFEVIEPELFLHPPVGLLAGPARLDGKGKCPEISVGRQVRQVALALA